MKIKNFLAEFFNAPRQTTAFDDDLITVRVRNDEDSYPKVAIECDIEDGVYMGPEALRRVAKLFNRLADELDARYAA